ncbi:MAG: hypothetical protein PSN37_04805 [Alphaproteobacteria bacterium]|nr:hypothetical protein [Alphaproteobacteria bacterium]
MTHQKQTLSAEKTLSVGKKLAFRSASAGKERTSHSVPLLLRSDYWDNKGRRYAKGVIVSVSIDTARLLLLQKKAERVDPLPGEEE